MTVFLGEWSIAYVSVYVLVSAMHAARIAIFGGNVKYIFFGPDKYNEPIDNQKALKRDYFYNIVNTDLEIGVHAIYYV